MIVKWLKKIKKKVFKCYAFKHNNKDNINFF